MTFPYSLKYIVKFGQIIGFLSRYEFKKKWQNQLMRIYCFLFNLIVVIALISHLLSTTTRSIRYLPEFYQRLFEDVAFYLFWGECLFYKVNLNRFDRLMNFMHRNFSTANMKVVESSHARAMFFLRLVFILMCASLSFSIIETYFPVSDEEIELLRYIYKRARPERRLQTNFWIPFLDDSESPTYEIMFYLEFYLIFLIAICSTVSFTAIPMLVTYMEGQYEILYLHVKMMGCVHRDYYGDVIYYTNFETGLTFKLNPKSDWKINQVVYDRYYCHQVIKFHLKLLMFQDKLREFNSPIMLLKIVLNNVLFALCIYQLTAFDFKSMSKARLYKLVLEFMLISVQYYYLCHSSEMLDDWQSRINRAITESHWYKCSKSTRRDIVMLLRRTQGPNHLNFYDGAIVLSRAYFLSVVKLSYTFVNFMRLNISR